MDTCKTCKFRFWYGQGHRYETPYRVCNHPSVGGKGLALQRRSGAIGEINMYCHLRGIFAVAALIVVATGTPSSAQTAHGGTGDAGEVMAKTVFLTSTTHQGNLGGLDGADAICQGLADTAGLGVTRRYRAWLASGDGSPDTLFLRSASPYVRTDGATVADDYTDLTTCDAASPFNCLQNPINVTEENVELTGFRPAWTNVLPSGLIHGVFSQDSCFYWTADLLFARVGNASHTTAGWTAAGAGFECGIASHLFCFEQ